MKAIILDCDHAGCIPLEVKRGDDLEVEPFHIDAQKVDVLTVEVSVQNSVQCGRRKTLRTNNVRSSRLAQSTDWKPCGPQPAIRHIELEFGTILIREKGLDVDVRRTCFVEGIDVRLLCVDIDSAPSLELVQIERVRELDRVVSTGIDVCAGLLVPEKPGNNNVLPILTPKKVRERVPGGVMPESW